MNLIQCEFEAEVLAATLQSRSDPALREHVADCEICSEIALIAAAMDDARAGEIPAVPDSGRVWWLAQLRARREAAKAAGRPITAAQVLAFACAIALLGTGLSYTSEWFSTLPPATTLLAEHALLATGIAALVFVIPAAVYLTLRKH